MKKFSGCERARRTQYRYESSRSIDVATQLSRHRQVAAAFALGNRIVEGGEVRRHCGLVRGERGGFVRRLSFVAQPPVKLQKPPMTLPRHGEFAQTPYAVARASFSRSGESPFSREAN